MNVACQCRAIVFTTPLPVPLALYICHCSECQRQSSSAFGSSAIFPRFSLPALNPVTQLPLPLKMYSRPTASGHILDCFFCGECGTRVMHAVRDDKRKVVSVKGGCIEGLDWKNAKHIWTKNALVPIPEGVEKYEEEPPDDDDDELTSVSEQGENTESGQVLEHKKSDEVGLRGSGGQEILPNISFCI